MGASWHPAVILASSRPNSGLVGPSELLDGRVEAVAEGAALGVLDHLWRLFQIINYNTHGACVLNQQANGKEKERCLAS